MGLRSGAAAAASLALHALGVWVALHARRPPDHRPAPEEPLLVDVFAPAPRATGGALPPAASHPRRMHTLPPPPTLFAAPTAPPPPPAPRPPLRLDLPLALAPAAPLHPAFNPQALPAAPPMEAPGTDVDSVLEFKREHERPTAPLPEAFAKLFQDRAEERRDYSIRRRKDGSSVYRDERAHRFDATLAPDGTLAFDDHHIHGRSLRDQFRKWIADPLHNAPPLPSLMFGFDATDELMRAHGEDPYAAVKRKLLGDTLAERQRMADEHRRETMTAALVGLRPFLRALWDDATRSPAAKRKLLLELAAETDEATPAGRRAREIILEFLDQFGNR